MRGREVTEVCTGVASRLARATALLAVVLAGASPLLAQQKEKNLSAPDLVDKVRISVLFLLAESRAAGKAASGSGFVAGPSGLVVTNFHVVDGMCSVVREAGAQTAVSVNTEGKQNLGEPLVVAWNQKRDLAVLRLQGKSVPGVPLGDSDKLRLGEEVIALGFPWSLTLGFDLTFSQGNLSATRTLEGLKTIQHTASIAPGSSGGPLFNTAGEVVGVNFAYGGQKVKAQEGEEVNVPLAGNINWAIPSNDVLPLLAEKANATPFRAFCSGLAGKEEHPAAAPNPEDSASVIFQSDPQCLDPGSRAEFSGELQAGKTYVVAVKRLQGTAKLAFGISSSREDFRGTDQEKENGLLILPYTPTRTAKYTIIVGTVSGTGRTCFLVALLVAQPQGR